MSYDIYCENPVCEHCGRRDLIEVRANSPTYNYSPMIRKADELAGGDGCSFAAIDGKTGKEAGEWFSLVLGALVAHRDAIQQLEPNNGWGDYQKLLEIFREYVVVAIENPTAVWTQNGDGGKRMRCCAGWECGE